MKSKLLLATLAVLCVSVFGISQAQSAPATFSFDIDGTEGVFGDPGTTVVLGSHTVESSLVGRSCSVTVDVHNNDSVREGTDILVASGTTTLTLANVEHLPGNAPPAAVGTLVLGSTVTGSVRFGPAGATSVAATIVVDCPDVPTTTTTTAPPTTTTTQVAGTVVTRTEVVVAGVVAVQPRLTG
jgi:hypothetical protein